MSSTPSPITNNSRPVGPSATPPAECAAAEFFRAQVLPSLAVSGDWLDVGCGSGVFSRMLAEAGARVLASMVLRGCGAARTASLAGAALRGWSRRGRRGAERSLRRAICLSVIEYLRDPSAALAAVAGRLKPAAARDLAPNRASTLRAANA